MPTPIFPDPKRFFLLIAFFAIAGPLFAYDNVVEMEAHGAGMGGAVAAVSGGSHAVLWNPAGIARATVPMIQAGGAYRTAPTGFGLDTVLLYPTRDHTVFALSRYSVRTLGALSSSMIVASIGVPLSSNRDLLFGANLKHLTLSDESGPVSRGGRGIGLDVGLVYDFHLPSGADVLSMALAVRDANTQVRFKGSGEESATRVFVAGLAFQKPNMRFELDYEAVDRTLTASVLHDRLKLGAERFFKDRQFSVRVGYDDLLQSGGRFTAGGGYHPAAPIEILYAAALSEKDRSVQHYASFVFRFDRWFPKGGSAGGRPEIDLATGEASQPTPTRSTGRPIANVPLKKRNLSVNPAAFSPNGDGRNDSVTVGLPEIAEGEVERWELDFESRDGRLELRRSGRGIPPPKTTWDGRNSEGKVARDGVYRVVLRTFAEGDVLLSEDDRTLELLSGKVTFGLTANVRYFSPNRAGRKILFTVRSGGLAEVGSWEFEVSESNTNRVIYATQGQSKLPKRIEWNGRTARGESVPDGNYVCMLVAEDKAGNRLQGDALKLGVDSQPPELQLKVQDPWIDPGAGTGGRIGLDAADRNGISFWRLVLADDQGREVRTFTGRGDPPTDVFWDGKDQRGSDLPPGSFLLARFTGVDVAGNEGSSDATGLQLTVAPPSGKAQLTLNLTTVLFGKGNAELSEEALKELTQAARSIKPYLEKSTILLRGYVADDEAGSALILSHQRVSAARRVLAEALGVPEGRLLSMAMGMREPLLTGAGPAPPDKQRRVVVTLYAQQ